MNTPPKILMRFLRWFCRRDLVDGIEGDLIELYQRRLDQRGRLRANILFLFNVMQFLQPFAFRRKQKSRLNKMDIWLNYLKIATRSLLKARLYTGINVAGMSLGISCFVLISAYFLKEISYEKDFVNHQRIYRITWSYDSDGEKRGVAKAAFPLKKLLLSNYPEVESITRFYCNRQDATTLRFDDKIYTEDKLFFTDPEVFKVFDFKWVEGNPNTALENKNSIVLTKEMAVKYFGDEDPMYKFLEFKNSDRLQVTGIIEKNRLTHLDFDFLAPVELQRQRWKGEASNNGYDLEDDWRWAGSWMYVMLKDPTLAESFRLKILADGEDFFGRIENSEVLYQYGIQPLADIHLNSQLSGEIAVNGSKKQVYGIAGVGLLILLVACINFINLMTAQSTDRSKEIGLRKIIGAHRSHLIFQFLSESFLVVLLGVIIGFILIQLMMPYFNSFMMTDIMFSDFLTLESIGLLFGGTLLLALFAGFYPSIFLSSFKSLDVLKGRNQLTGSNGGLRKVLVVSQFVISNLLIIGILVIEAQMDFVKNKDLGFEKDQVIILDHGSKLDESYGKFRTRLLEDPRIDGVNLGYVPGTRGWTQSFWIDGVELETSKGMGFKHVSYEFVDLFGMEIIHGRDFSRDFVNDLDKSILLNESALRKLGWTAEEAMGKTFSYIGGTDNRTRYDLKVIGIVKDANLESLYQPVRPSVFRISEWGDVSVKFNVKDRASLISVIDFVEEAWMEVAPSWPFEFRFLDQTIERQYAKDDRLSQAFVFFGLISVIIACLGLFGLSAYSVRKRSKEIGVRKVLGASIWSIMNLISVSFAGLILLSFIFSIPVGYYLSIRWLEDFEYRIELGTWIFLLSCLTTFVVAVMTVTYQSMEAARLDPVRTLRDE